jgi:hypothetical protein
MGIITRADSPRWTSVRMMEVMKPSDLIELVRLAIAVCSVLTAGVALTALRGRTPADRDDAAPFLRIAVPWALVSGAAAFFLSHGGKSDLGVVLLPVGTMIGVGLAIASLFFPPARRAFDRLTDYDVRAISAWRTVFGAFLFAGAGLGLFPPVFALVAGTGDLVAGALATVSPRSLAVGGGRGSRFARLLVHGVGAVDFVDVLAMAFLVVRPWLIETGSPGPSLLLPWLAVPIVLALNLHGLRSALTEGHAREDGLEPARGV